MASILSVSINVTWSQFVQFNLGRDLTGPGGIVCGSGSSDWLTSTEPRVDTVWYYHYHDVQVYILQLSGPLYTAWYCTFVHQTPRTPSQRSMYTYKQPMALWSPVLVEPGTILGTLTPHTVSDNQRPWREQLSRDNIGRIRESHKSWAYWSFDTVGINNSINSHCWAKTLQHLEFGH